MPPRPGKVNVIWFSDDQPARRLRLRPGLAKAAVFVFVLAVALAAAGAFAAWQYRQVAQEALLERREAEKRLSEALISLERLQNIEKILQTSDPSELTLLLAGLGLELQPTRGRAEQAKGRDEKAPSRDKPAAQPQERPAGMDLAELVGRLDAGQVSVENFRARTDGKTVQFSFDLSNQQAQPLSGSGQIFLVTRDAVMTPLPVAKEDLGFNIQRFKQVQSQASFPKGVDPANLFGFRLVLSNASGKPLFTDTYQLDKAQ